jgi:hypothetical protein
VLSGGFLAYLANPPKFRVHTTRAVRCKVCHIPWVATAGWGGVRRVV